MVQALADSGDPEMFDALIATDDEYLLVCGVVGLGRRLADAAVGGAGAAHAGADTRLGEIEARLRGHAADGRWRVREAVAMALQRLGDADVGWCQRLAAAWADDPDPLVQRAAVAAVCEPRLLASPPAARAAVDLCDRVTAALSARPTSTRRSADVRTLRQALGYGWSVAVAADPDAGLPRFRALEGSRDPDVGWIIRENKKKSRLAKLL